MCVCVGGGGGGAGGEGRGGGTASNERYARCQTEGMVSRRASS